MKTRSILFVALIFLAFGALFAGREIISVEASSNVSIADSPQSRPFSPTDRSLPYEFVYDDGIGSLLFTSYTANSYEGLRISALYPCSLRTLEFYCMGPGTLEVRIWQVDSIGGPLNTELITPHKIYIDSISYFPSWEEVTLPTPLYMPAFGECLVGRRVTSATEPVTVYLTRMEDIEDRSFLKRGSPTWMKPTYYDDTLDVQWDVTFMIRAYGDYYGVPDQFWFDIDSTITTTNRGVAFGDFDLDGDFDMLTGGQLFGNTGGNFTVLPGTGMSGSGTPYWGEFDLNLYPDPYIAGTTDKLYANNSGAGNFYDVTSVAGGIDDPYPTNCAAWLDYDNDGDLDLYVTNGGIKNPTTSAWTYYRDYLYENDGAYFFEVTDAAGMSSTIYSPQYGQGIALGDWNNDGYTDVYVANTNGHANYLWMNTGGGFMDVGYGIGVDGVNEGGGVFGWSYGACFGDIDNDGDLDLFVANYSPGRKSPNSDKSFLYINLGAPDYYMWDESAERGIGFVPSRSLPFMIDFDNDGWLDIYVVSTSGKSFARLYRNLGDGTFEDVTFDAGLGLKNVSGGAWSDIDHDGDLDFIAEVGSKKYICRNRYSERSGITNNWARFTCRGESSNKLGIGTKVSVKAGGLWQTREIGTGYGGSGCQSEYAAHFGLGIATSIDSVIIRWQSGIVEIATGLSINTRYIVTEGTFAVEENIPRPTDFALNISPNPFNGAVRIEAPVGAEIEIFDVNGRVVTPQTPLDRGELINGDLGGLIWRPDPSVTSGIYLVRTTIGNESATKRVVYLK
jgi:hypothetical protein